MIFKGNPGEVLTYRPRQHDRIKKVRHIGKFDENGLLEVTEPVFIKRMLEKGFKAEEKKIVCKKCGAEFDNKGLFMAHCRAEHPKAGDEK